MNKETNELVRKIDTGKNNTLATFQNADMEQMFNSKTLRKVKDILAHITYWEEMACKSIESFLKGEEFTVELPLDIDKHNQMVFEKFKDHSSQEVFDRYEDIQARFSNLVTECNSVNKGKEMVYPWGKSGTVSHLVIDMVDHEYTHCAQIKTHTLKTC